MSDVPPPQFECEHCAKHYPWTPTNIGREFRCICGAVAPYPAEPLPADDLYSLADAPPQPTSLSAPLPTAPQTKTLNYTAATPPTIADTQTIRNFYMPFWLLVASLIIELLATALRSTPFFSALFSIITQLIASTFLTLLGVFLAAKIRNIHLGSFYTVTFKLAALSIAPSAALDLANPALSRVPLLGGLLGLAGAFILYFALLGALFDLDESDTWYCLWTIFLMRLFYYFTMLYIIK